MIVFLALELARASRTVEDTWWSSRMISLTARPVLQDVAAL
ncbi:hypothetical protein RMSM_06777 [Rhodopirellula maiorica SM1]|uniref:Uncharacterized protein n=1 Tax=Rhodopirellula maiorica SM1 TaxID=1265738 RepID=M5R9Z1_9BACT|nr:hypothetical protein RMSM_06777 [Rhodopirellula maiorica SM1]